MRLPDRLRLPALALGCLLALAPAASAFQPPAKERVKEPTDGFFDGPPKDPNAVEEPSYGVPSYMITSCLGGLAMFILCKSARRG